MNASRGEGVDRQMPGHERAEARWSTTLGGVYLLRGQFRAPFGPHLHTRHILGVVDQGSVIFSRDGRSWAATRDDLIALPPHEVHEDRGLDGQPWTWRLLYAGADTVRSAGGWARQDVHRMVDGPVVRDSALAGRFSQLFDALWSGDAADGEVSVELSGLLVEVFRPHSPLPDAPPGRMVRARARIGVVRDYLHYARANAVGIRYLADLAQLSPFHLIRAFRAETGLPPHAYYQQVRLARAKELLWQGRALSEVAFGLGFSDQSHFCREFKRTTQITPREYAAMIRASGVHWATGTSRADGR